MLGCTRYYFHTIVRAKNRIGPHNEEIISVLIGLLLGDGYAKNRTGEGVRIAIKQSIIHKEYLFLLYKFFQDQGYCSNNPPSLYTRKIKTTNKIYYGYEFNTFTFRSFIWIYNLFYKNGIKKLSLNKTFMQYIKPLTLAIWISDDGTWTGEVVRIATNAFSLKEIQFLVHILENKFKLDKINLNNYWLEFNLNNINKIYNITKPYIFSSMKFKFITKY